ncbi:hypothetical protein FOZ62_020487, partial [Perkinsus olseni]
MLPRPRQSSGGEKVEFPREELTPSPFCLSKIAELEARLSKMAAMGQQVDVLEMKQLEKSREAYKCIVRPPSANERRVQICVMQKEPPREHFAINSKICAHCESGFEESVKGVSGGAESGGTAVVVGFAGNPTEYSLLEAWIVLGADLGIQAGHPSLRKRRLREITAQHREDIERFKVDLKTWRDVDDAVRMISPHQDAHLPTPVCPPVPQPVSTAPDGVIEQVIRRLQDEVGGSDVVGEAKRRRFWEDSTGAEEERKADWLWKDAKQSPSGRYVDLHSALDRVIVSVVERAITDSKNEEWIIMEESAEAVLFCVGPEMIEGVKRQIKASFMSALVDIAEDRGPLVVSSEPGDEEFDLSTYRKLADSIHPAYQSPSVLLDCLVEQVGASIRNEERETQTSDDKVQKRKKEEALKLSKYIEVRLSQDWGPSKAGEESDSEGTDTNPYHDLQDAGAVLPSLDALGCQYRGVRMFGHKSVAAVAKRIEGCFRVPRASPVEGEGVLTADQRRALRTKI